MEFRSLGKKLRLVQQNLLYERRTEPAMEIIYRDLFVRDLRDTGLVDCYYPVGGAASHSLLYLLLRSIREFHPQRVLELGAGQSTLLIDAANGALRLGMDVITVEHDADWAAHIQKRVSHPLVHRPLAAGTEDGKPIQYYAPGFLPEDARFNLVVIDGPPAHEQELRFSRIGCLQFLPQMLADDFILIIDDAEREGEAYLVDRLAERFASLGRTVRNASAAGKKRQTWFCGGRFHAEFF